MISVCIQTYYTFYVYIYMEEGLYFGPAMFSLEAKLIRESLIFPGEINKPMG